MTVFKLYFKLVKKNINSIISYLIIFLALTIFFVISSDTSLNSFEFVKTDVTYIDNDNTKLTNGLKDYLGNFANYKDIKEEKLEDAFFYRDIEVIVEIPKGFTDSFTTDNINTIKIRVVPSSATSATFQQELQKYLNFANTYLKNDLPTENLHESVVNDLSKVSNVDITQETSNDFSSIHFYYNYLAYIIAAVLITVIGTIMLSFKPIDLKRRNQISMLSNNKMNLVLIFANTILGLSILLALIIVSIILYPSLIFEPNGLLFILNSFLFTISIIALTYLIVVIFDSKDVVSALGTIVSLGLSFITGVFIPQALLDEGLLKIARIIPSYWYIAGNDKIVNLTNFSGKNMESVIIGMLVQILFTVVFILIAIFISKKKQRVEH